jgi:hypothetical protein
MSSEEKIVETQAYVELELINILENAKQSIKVRDYDTAAIMVARVQANIVALECFKTILEDTL